MDETETDIHWLRVDIGRKTVLFVHDPLSIVRSLSNPEDSTILVPITIQTGLH